MKCICEKWFERVYKGENIYMRGERITHCPYCGLELIKDDFRVHITYDGPEEDAIEDAIKNALASFDVKKSPGKKKLYFDLQLI